MASGQPPAPVDLGSFAAFIGIDWADQKHDIALRAAGSDRLEFRQLRHSPEVLDEWIMQLHRRVDGRIAVAVELTRGPLINALHKYDFITIIPIPPARLASYRQAFRSSGAKDDPTDAQLILDYLQKHPEQLRPWVPEDPLTRQLAILCENRRNLVDLQTGLSNRLGSTLKLYFPQALQWLSDLCTKLSCDFLHRWPTLQSLQRAKPNSIRKFLRDHNARCNERIEEIIQQLGSAVPLTTDSAIINACSPLAVGLVCQIRALAKSIAEFDSRIEELFTAHPDAAIFQSLPGAGAALAPRLLVAMGTDRSRYEDAAQVQRYSGIAPVTIRSGKTKRVQRRLACPKFLKQTFHEFAAISTRFCPWAAAYYDQMRQRGMKHHAAVRALAFKWIRVIYACWRDRVPYDEQRYHQALRAAGSPLVKLIP